MRRRRRFASDLGVYGSPGDVFPWDIRFDPDDRAHVDAADDGRLSIRVWTEPGLSEGMCVIRTGDGTVTGEPLEPVTATARFVVWQGTFAPPEPKFDYSFAFRSPAGRPIYRVPSGITNAVERADRWRYDGVAPLNVPAWARGAVIYQIFPDRFSVGDETLTAEPIASWGDPPDPRRFHGGDLWGVVQRLPYLSALGVDALYLNPVFTSPSNHRYDTIDYYAVDPSLGGDAALEALVEQAHRRNLRVVLDASFNHVHPRFFAFQDVIEQGPDSPYFEWFVVEHWPLEIRYRGKAKRQWFQAWSEQLGLPLVEAEGPGPEVEPTYQAWYGTPTMPRVDLAHPAARRYMLDVARYWVETAGIDGWRMDVARYVDFDFWRDFRQAVKSVDPDCYLVAELMGDASQWLQGDRFDATMNYTFRSLCLGFFARDDLDGPGLMDGAARLLAGYAEPVTAVNHNLIGSHDVPRFLTEAGGEQWRIRLATIFQLTFPGAPGIYYGDEVGLEGGEDPGSRAAFPWSSLPEEDPLRHPVAATVAELTRLRRRHRALREGTWRPVDSGPEWVAFERRRGRSRLVVVINRSRHPIRLDVGGAGLVWGAGLVSGSDLEVPGRDACVVRPGPTG